jgi:hypothetical protein
VARTALEISRDIVLKKGISTAADTSPCGLGVITAQHGPGGCV